MITPNPGPILPRAVIEPDKPITTSFSTIVIINAPMAKIIKSAKLYRDLLNVNIANENIKRALIQIKMHNGEDTYAYLLNIYEDYKENNLSESTFLEILFTIDDYLKNRVKTPNNVGFNELIQYLNAFITCK